MKRILSIFLLLLTVLLVSSRLFASTSVGSSLSTDTQWDQSGSPYIIQSSVLVPPGVTLKIEPGVQVVFQGPATLQISGELKVEGSAAAPAVINMTNGGLQNAFFIDGGEARLSNMKVLGGVFLAQDATISMNSSEITKGSGLYLKGNTIAHLKNNKFYGNATGVVLDGSIEADMQFNTLVQNTYGLYIKDFTKFSFVNNSIHDNDSEVVNNASKANLGGNYWGTLRPQIVKDKIKGTVSISPMRDIKDILRAYLRTELPLITKSMSDQAEAEDDQADRAARQALQEFRKKQHESEMQTIEANNRKMIPTPTVMPATTTIAFVEATATVASVPEPAPAAVSSTTSMGMSSSSSLPAPPDLGMAGAPSSAMPAAMPTSSGQSLPAPPDLMTTMPPPPSPSTVSEPPALGNLAASAATPVPTAGLGGAPVSSDDLASIVATAQAASTPPTQAPLVDTPSPTPIPTLALPVSGSDQSSTSTPVDLSQASSPVVLPPAATDTPTFTSTPIVVSTDTFTSTPTYTSTIIPTDTATFTTTFTDTFTSTPVVSIPTSTPVVLIPTSTPVVSNVAPPPVSSSPAPGSLVPVTSNDAVPPPPDFGDSSNVSGVQAPMVVPNNNPPPPPLPAAAAQPAAPAPTADVDVDGMQAPPMDSGLDYAAPKK